MVKKIFFFDLDDTLLDNFAAFCQTLKQYFPEREQNHDEIKKLYVTFRLKSEAIYEESLSNEPKKVTSEFDRWKLVFNYFQQHFTQADLAVCDQQYHIFQKEQSLLPEYQRLFEKLQTNGVMVGVFTNGFATAQTNKIKQLNLTQHIPADQLFVSDLFGDAKPNVSCFEKLKEVLPTEVEKFFYVGDSYKNDVVPAYHAGWQPVWLNRFNERKVDYHTYQANDFDQLRHLIEELI